MIFISRPPWAVFIYQGDFLHTACQLAYRDFSSVIDEVRRGGTHCFGHNVSKRAAAAPAGFLGHTLRSRAHEKHSTSK
jgi:hypothetical protein